MRTKLKEVLFAIVMTLISSLLIYSTYTYPSESVQFPRFLMFLQCAFSVMLLIRALRLPGGITHAHDPADTEGSQDHAEATVPGNASARSLSRDRFKLWTPVQVFIAVTAYILAIEHIGYFVATALFLCGSMVFFGRNKASTVIGATAGCLVVIYVLFGVLIGIRLPTGLLI